MATTEDVQKWIDQYGDPAGTGLVVKDSSGKIVGEMPYSEESGKAFFTDKKVYKDSAGKWSTTPEVGVSLNEDTGKITIKAPKSYLEDKDKLAAILDTDSLKYLTSLYQDNKDAKVTMSDGSETKVTDLVSNYDKALRDYANARTELNNTKYYLTTNGKKDVADALTMDEYQIMGANGLGSKKDTNEDSWLAIPNAILNDKRWSFLKDFDSFNAEKQMVKTSEFIEKYYKLNAGRDLFTDEGIKDLKEAANKAYAKAGVEDMTDWARSYAFAQFLNQKEAAGDFWNTLATNTVAGAEGVARATAVVVPGAINTLWNIGAWAVSYLNPLQVYNIGGAGGYDPDASYNFLSDPVDNVANFVGGVTGLGYLVPDGQHFDEILSDQYAERGQFYQATNSGAATMFTLSYIGTSVAEGFAVGKAESQLLANLIFTPALGRQMKGIAENAELLDTITSEGVSSIAVGENTIPVSAFLDAKNSTTAGVIALTGKADPTFIDTVKALVSTNPQAALNGTLYLQALFGQAGQAYRAQAIGNLERLAEYYKNTRAQLEAAGMSAEAIEATEFYANVLKNAQDISKVFSVANQWYSNALATARALDESVRIASVMPHLAAVSSVVFASASKNPEAVRAILSGSASEEDKNWAMQQIALNIAAYGVGMLLSKGSRAFLKTNAAEKMNVSLTKGMARVSEAVTDWTDAVKVKLLGNDWRMRTTNPQKRESLMIKQLEDASQSWIAHASDGLKGAEATKATQAAVLGTKTLSNTITEFEPQRSVRRKLDIYHSGAFPAYNAASKATTGTIAKLSELLDKHNIETPSKPEALVGGSDATLGTPLELTNYMSRLLINQQYINIMGGKEDTELLLPADEKEYNISKDVIKATEENYPAEITDYIKNEVVPALKAEARELVQVELAEGIGRRSKIEGFQETTRFGKNGEDWFPIMRITTAQKSYDEGLKMLSDNKTMGTIAIRNLKTDYHYKPGSDKMTDFVHPALVLQRRALDLANRALANSLMNRAKEIPTLKYTTLMSGEETEVVHTFNDLTPSINKAMGKAMNQIREDSSEANLLKDTFNVRKARQRAEAAQRKVASAKESLETAMAKETLPITKTDKLNVVKNLSSDDLAGLLGDNSVQIAIKNADDFDKFWADASRNVKKLIRESISQNSQKIDNIEEIETDAKAISSEISFLGKGKWSEIGKTLGTTKKNFVEKIQEAATALEGELDTDLDEAVDNVIQKKFGIDKVNDLKDSNFDAYVEIQEHLISKGLDVQETEMSKILSGPSEGKVYKPRRPSYDNYRRVLQFDPDLNTNINKALITEYAKKNCV